MSNPLEILPHSQVLDLIQAFQDGHHDGEMEFALLLVSIKRFREINIIHGYQAGDALLRQVNDHLHAMAREQDIVRRIGSARFLMLLPDLLNEGQVEMAAMRLQRDFAEPFNYSSSSIIARASVGIALYPAHGDAPATLLRNSEIAMLNARERLDGYCIYTSDHAIHDSTSWDIFSDLRSALSNDEFELHFQPQVSMSERSLIGAEALIRWHHPKRGNIPPNYFIPVAEQGEFIHQITEWTLNAALWAIRQWSIHDDELKVSVNISPRSLLYGDLGAQIQRSAEVFDSDLSRLTLEITETALMEDMATCVQIIDELKSMGIMVSIDDFGTGYSSMAYFRHIPADELKIDQSFVRNIRDSAVDTHIVRSIIELAKGFDLQLVAEGIEDATTFDLLNSLGCDIAQGWHIAKPMPQDQFIEWIKNHQ